MGEIKSLFEEAQETAEEVKEEIVEKAEYDKPKWAKDKAVDKENINPEVVVRATS